MNFKEFVAYNDSLVFNKFQHFTEEHSFKVRGLPEALKMNASMQNDDVDFSSTDEPLFAYKKTCYYIEPDNSIFNSAIKKDAIIYIDDESYRILDSAYSHGVRTLSLVKGER